MRRVRHRAGSSLRGQFNYEVDKRGNRTRAFERLAQSTTVTTTYNKSATQVTFTRGTWTDAGDFKQTAQFSGRMQIAYTGDEALLTVGVGPDHGIIDISINGRYWRRFDAYATTPAERVIHLPQVPTLPGETSGTLEIRNHSDRHHRSTGHVFRFKQLAIIDTTYADTTIDYTYDALSRLQQANYNTGQRIYDYNFDLAGNRIQEALSGTSVTAKTTDYTYNAANQMTYNGRQLTYDPNGNLTSDGTNSYTWDRANRLAKVDNGTPADLTAYAYDGVNNRISQSIGTANPIVTQYLLDTQPGLVKVLAQTTGTTTDHYIHAPRGIHAQSDGTNWQYITQDGLGSVRSLIDSTLGVDTTHSYDPYGNYIGTAPTTAYFGFTGEQTDPNGQLYLRARYYNPALATFSSLDPFQGTMARPMSLNGYSWVVNNPINRVDPTGMFDWGTFTIEQDDTLSCIAAEAEIPPNEFEAFFYAVQAINNSLYRDDSVLSNPPTLNNFCSEIGGPYQTTYNPVEAMVNLPPQTLNNVCMSTTVFVSPQPIVYSDRICYGKQILIPDVFGSRSGIIATGRRNEHKFCCGGLSGNTCGQQAPYTNPTDTKMLVTGFYGGGEITINDILDLNPSVSYDNLSIAFEWYTETLGGRQGWVASTSFNLDAFNVGSATGNAGGKIGAWNQWPNQGDYLISESYNFGLGPAAVSFSPENVGQNPISALLQGDFVMQFGVSGGTSVIDLVAPAIGRGATVSLYLGDGSFDEHVLWDLLNQSDNREKLSYMLQLMDNQQLP